MTYCPYSLGGYDCNVVHASIPTYIQLMNMVRLSILFVASLAAGQQNHSVTSPNTPEPTLPVIDYDSCPGRGEPISNVKLVKDELIYSSPDKGKLVAKLSAGAASRTTSGAAYIDLFIKCCQLRRGTPCSGDTAVIPAGGSMKRSHRITPWARTVPMGH